MAPHGSLDHPDQPLPLPPRAEAKETAASALAALDEDKCAGSFPRLRALPGHVFWKDDLSLIGSDLVNVDQIVTPGQVTDAYLLALAVANKGQLATFDRRLPTKAVRRGRAALHVIDGDG
jgi:predicted nucleic acid-binding protein